MPLETEGFYRVSTSWWESYADATDCFCGKLFFRSFWGHGYCLDKYLYQEYWDILRPNFNTDISDISQIKSFNCEKGWFSANTFEITIQHPYQYFIKISQNHMNHMVWHQKWPQVSFCSLSQWPSHIPPPTQRDPVDYFWVHGDLRSWRTMLRKMGGPDGPGRVRDGPRPASWQEGHQHQATAA